MYRPSALRQRACASPILFSQPSGFCYRTSLSAKAWLSILPNYPNGYISARWLALILCPFSCLFSSPPPPLLPPMGSSDSKTLQLHLHSLFVFAYLKLEYTCIPSILAASLQLLLPHFNLPWPKCSHQIDLLATTLPHGELVISLAKPDGRD